MGLIEAIKISHSFGDKILYKDASFELFKGEHMGLVGKNGAGKTTLLNSLIGKIIPDKGEFRVQRGIKVGFLDQHAKINNNMTIFEYLKIAFNDLYDMESRLNKLYEEMANNYSDDIMRKASNYQAILEKGNFYQIESIILKVADGLGITALGMNSILSKLSGGQRAKVILAKILLEKPHVLLLDEPTNFLDKEHVEWLTNYLQTFEGAFVVISHDFNFLDKITNCILDIEFFTIKKYSGNFSKFIELKNLKRESYIREFEAQQKQIKKYEDYIARNQARASTANMAKSRQKSLDRMERILPPETLPKPHFHFTFFPTSSENPLVAKNLEIGYYYPLLSKLNFEIKSEEKVVITGFNGIGKSTLLKTIIGEIPAMAGAIEFAKNTKIGYLEQDLKWENDNLNPIEIVSNKFPELIEKQVRKHLAQCGLKAKHAMQPVCTLSGGEQAKIKLCLLMITKANLLILDEPTNHLDSDAKEVLRKQLIKWKGSIILVSHELSFYKDWADKIMNVANLLK